MSSRSRKFLVYYRPYLGLLVADLVCAFLATAAALLLPLCVRYITKNILEANAPNALEQIYAVGALMLGLVFLHTLCNGFVDYQGHMMGARMEADMRRDLFEHYQKLSFAYYDEQRTGQLMSRITNDSLSLSELYHHGPEDIAIALVTLAGAFAILVTIDVPLTALIYLCLPFMGLYALYFNRRMNRALRVTRERMGDINAQVEDTLAGIRVVKSFTNEEIEQAKFEAENARFVDSRREGYKSEMWHSEGLIAATQLITVVVAAFGGVRILNGGLDLPDLLTFLLYVALFIDPIKRLVNFARLYQEGVTGFSRFMEIMELEPDIRDAPDAVDLTHVRGRIEFQDVRFRYREAQEYVLKHLFLTIEPGDFVALVGYSGVGKTTLCALIPRFYEVTGGRILLDGRDVRDLRLRSLRAAIGVVQQDVYLFAGTVAENIRYGKPSASREAIVEAARKANAHDFIVKLPHGYDTNIGQRGVRLSGGQKQRLSIARVFLKDPPVLIFDEATSALDNESERAVQSSLETLTAGRTTLVIAHRLSTIRNAQRIVVLGDDGIMEQGSHDELIARGGTYANLYAMQLKI